MNNTNKIIEKKYSWKCIRSLRKDLKNPNELVRAFALSNLSQIYYSKSKKGFFSYCYKKKNLSYLKKAIQYPACSPNCELEYSWICYRRGDLELAIKFINKAIFKYSKIIKASKDAEKSDFGLAYLFYLLGQYHHEFAHFDKAIKIFTSILKRIGREKNNTEQLETLRIESIRRLIIMYLFRNEFDNIKMLISKQILENDHCQKDDRNKPFFQIFSAFSSIEGKLPKFSGNIAFQDFLEGYFSKIYHNKSCKLLKALRNEILDSFYSSNITYEMGKIREVIENQESKIQEYSSNLFDECKRCVTDIGSPGNKDINSNDLRKNKTVMDAYISKIIRNIKKSNTSFNRAIRIMKWVRDKQFRLKFKQPFRLKWNFFILFLKGYILKILIIVFFFSSLIPFIINGLYALGLVSSFIISLVFWFISERWIEPWIDSKLVPQYKQNLVLLLISINISVQSKFRFAKDLAKNNTLIYGKFFREV